MFDKRLALETLLLVNESLEMIARRTRHIASVDDFYLSEAGMILLDSICMKLIAVGESIKNIDKITNKQLLPHYPEVPWKDVMGLRDIIVHHYFDVDGAQIFKTVKQDVPFLMKILNKMIQELQ